jgi:hypothetical protein
VTKLSCGATQALQVLAAGVHLCFSFADENINADKQVRLEFSLWPTASEAPDTYISVNGGHPAYRVIRGGILVFLETHKMKKKVP